VFFFAGQRSPFRWCLSSQLVQDRLVAFKANPTAHLATSATSGIPPGVGAPPSASSDPGGGGGEVTSQVAVPAESLGAVIGRGGSRIAEVRSLSGAKVTIATADPAAAAAGPLRTVTVTGTAEAVGAPS